VCASFVTIREPKFNFKHASDDCLVVQPPDEDGEAVHHPDGIGIGIPDPGKGPDYLFGIGGRPDPCQQADG